MKHLKKYNESINKYEDLRDILLELEDDGFVVGIKDTTFNRVKCWYIYIRRPVSKTIFYWDDIKDCVLRIKDYLGDDYITLTGFFTPSVLKIDNNTDIKVGTYLVNIVFENIVFEK